MPPTDDSGHDYVSVAEIEIDAVHPGRSGFVLTGRGIDRADYRLELVLEMPVDQRTKAVLAELLAQSDWRIQRRAPEPFRSRRLSAMKKSTTK
ncbi:MAG: hypothetical protein AMS20_11735 [Gemmatimonas sp. SG8_28]|jgi:hypothetical protein|nr:MAG: hypothetical protein AMS20_11735 [Gemmatimonas sp. SG8_28]